jgi:hypothetical protein
MEIVCENCEHDHGLKEEGIAAAQARAENAPQCACGCQNYEPIPVVEEPS